jgi:acyl-coenzyme A thioesterase PaaI-like protein
MIKTALEQMTLPPTAKLLDRCLLDVRPDEGWLKVKFNGKREFCNPAGFVQGGLLSAMLDDTMNPAAFVMTGRMTNSSLRRTSVPRCSTGKNLGAVAGRTLRVSALQEARKCR